MSTYEINLDGYDGERAVTYLRNLARESRDVLGESPSPRGKLANLIADQIERQTRIPEPGMYGVVEAGARGLSGRREFCRLEDDSEGWSGAGTWFRWSQLIDPVLVRDGIEETS